MMGEEIIHLNELRTQVRALEIAAMNAFRQGADVKRKDIICVLNRLSSAIYILMCRTLGERMAE
jgi:ethanolamine utilization cobalamin adenosyltransferase